MLRGQGQDAALQRLLPRKDGGLYATDDCQAIRITQDIVQQLDGIPIVMPTNGVDARMSVRVECLP